MEVIVRNTSLSRIDAVGNPATQISDTSRLFLVEQIARTSSAVLLSIITRILTEAGQMEICINMLYSGVLFITLFSSCTVRVGFAQSFCRLENCARKIIVVDGRYD